MHVAGNGLHGFCCFAWMLAVAVMLTEKRQTWAKNRRRVQFKGLPLHNPVSIEERYARELQALVRVMTKETQRELLAVFRGEVAEEFFAEDASITSLAKKTLNKLRVRFEKLFSDKANEVVQKMIAHVSKESKSRLQSSLKEMSGGLNVQLPEMPAQLKEVFAASVVENVALIKSIPQQYHDRVTGAVMRSITSADGGIGKLTDELQKYSGMSLRRARLVAMDQTRKAYQAANIERSKSAGITKGIWIHTGGTKEPRPRHKAYNGKEFELAKGAPVGDNGEYVHCGEEPYCRCTFVPILDFGED